MKVADFDQIPAQTRQNAKGREASPLLKALRDLKVKQKIVLDIKEDFPNAKTFEQALNQVTQKTQKLDYRPNVRSNSITGIIEIYRNEGSDYAKDADGNPVLSEPVGEKQRRRRLTVSEINK